MRPDGRPGRITETIKSRLEWARFYQSLGWAPIPLRVGDKRPFIPWEAYQTCKPTDEEIAAWFSRWPEANIGIVTGEISQLVVLDVDPAHGGSLSLTGLEAANKRLPPTAESLTGGGGRHFYFRYPGFSMRNRTAIAAGLDVRADGGYIVAPPSIHPSGGLYRWVEGHEPSTIGVAQMPSWLIEVAIGGRKEGGGHPLSHWRDLIHEGVDAGERNNTIASLSGHLLWHGVDPEIILDLLLCWNAMRCRPPLSEDEVARTVKNILKTHERNRQTPGV